MKTKITSGHDTALLQLLSEAGVNLPQPAPLPKARKRSLGEVAAEVYSRVHPKLPDTHIPKNASVKVRSPFFRLGMFVLIAICIGGFFGLMDWSEDVDPTMSGLEFGGQFGMIAMGIFVFFWLLIESGRKFAEIRALWRYLFKNPPVVPEVEVALVDPIALFREWADKERKRYVEKFSAQLAQLQSKCSALQERRKVMETYSKNTDAPEEIRSNAARIIEGIDRDLAKNQEEAEKLEDEKNVLSAGFTHMVNTLMPRATLGLRFVADVEATQTVMTENLIEIEKSKLLREDTMQELQQTLIAVREGMQMVDTYSSDLRVLDFHELREIIPAEVIEAQVEAVHESV